MRAAYLVRNSSLEEACLARIISLEEAYSVRIISLEEACLARINCLEEAFQAGINQVAASQVIEISLSVLVLVVDFDHLEILVLVN